VLRDKLLGASFALSLCHLITLTLPAKGDARMRGQAKRYWKLCVALSCGGMTLGVFQGLQLVNFAQLFSNFLSMLLAVLVSVLFGANPSTLFTPTPVV
jgi:hypothetical protein